MITQTLKLNLIPGQVLPRVNVSQYDYGSRTLEFKLFNGNQSFTLTSSMTAKISGTKADMHGFEYDATVDTTNQKIVADLNQQMTAAAGDVTCELIIKKSGERLGTCNFVIAVEKAALGDDTIISDTELPGIIAEATAQMEAAAESASQAATSATSAASSASSASTSASNAATSESNAQTSASNAASSATSASTSATNAATSATNAAASATSASTSATNANADALKSEGYAVGKQNGVNVGSDSEYYHNNAKYFKEQASSIVDCVSWDDFAELGAVNLCENVFTSQVINDVTFTKNSDGSLTVSGIASGSITTSNYTGGYIFNTTLNAGTYKISVGQDTKRIYYRLNDGSPINVPVSGMSTFTVDTDDTAFKVWFYCNSGYVANETYYPMLTVASYNGDYVPYAKSNKELTEDTIALLPLLDNTEVNGAVNMLPNTATTQTLNGVTFTVNSDGSITANGTSTGNSTTWFYLLGRSGTDYKMLPNIVGRAVKLTGCPSGGGTRIYMIRFFERTPTTVTNSDYGDGSTFTVQDNLTGCNCAIGIGAGITVSNLTFKPMLTVASYTGDYVPYAKSNKELTDDVATNTTDISTLQNIIGELSLTGAQTVSANDSRNFTIPNNYRGVCYVFGVNADRITQVMLYCTNAGSIYYKEIASADNVSFSTSTNTLTITNSSSTNLVAYFLNLRESASA